MFLELLPSLVDRLIQLVTVRETRSEKQFQELVEAIFVQLQDVHTNYLRIFEETRTTLLSGANIHDAGRLLEINRLSKEANRRSIYALAEQTADTEALKDLRPFARAASEYLFSTNDLNSASGALVKALYRSTDDIQQRQEVIKVVDQWLEYVRRNWSNVCEQRSRLMLKRLV